jgi:cytochrome c oxidase subunit 3
MRQRNVLDVSNLPTYGFDDESPMWWGTLGFVALEATGFALGIGSYLYLAVLSPAWPIGAPVPDLGPGTITLLVLVASIVPNHLLSRWSKKEELGKVQIGLIIMSIVGVLPLLIRIFEFPALHVSWDDNAYGSIVWLLLGLHTTHLLTDLGDTLVLTALMFTRHGANGKRFSDVSDNAFYWDFVVAAWVVLYLLIYWYPRLLK